ncbi:MAG: hypothetical protein GXP10_02790 [Gammaproteobacteria bacterium]|nr:hypothetical protein [Gammaproteobacteria bacterium]
MTLKCGCPQSYPQDWDGEDVDLSHHCVHILPIPTFIHMPLAYESYTKKQNQDIERLELEEPWPGLTLTQTGALRGRIIRLLDASTRSPSRRVEFLPTPFNVRAKLHHGNVSTIRYPVSQMSLDLLESGRRPKELYLCHLACPQCHETGDKILFLRRWVKTSRAAKSEK